MGRKSFKYFISRSFVSCKFCRCSPVAPGRDGRKIIFAIAIFNAHFNDRRRKFMLYNLKTTPGPTTVLAPQLLLLKTFYWDVDGVVFLNDRRLVRFCLENCFLDANSFDLGCFGCDLVPAK